MGCNFKRLYKKPKVFSRITGVSIEEFEKILKRDEPIWEKKVERVKVVSGRPYGLNSLEGHILCLLIYYRAYLTQEFLGSMFDVDDSCISRSIRRIAKALAPVLGNKYADLKFPISVASRRSIMGIFPSDRPA